MLKQSQAAGDRLVVHSCTGVTPCTIHVLLHCSSQYGSSRCPHQRLHHGATGHAPDLAAAPQIHAVEQAKEEAGCKQVACTRGVHRLAAGREAGT